MRQDRYIDNDSGAYSILPSWVVPKVIDDGRENDAKFVKKHQAILQSLVGDDSFIARVVVDEPLTDAEQREWISRVRWPLRVKCGKLLISGGYDPDVIAELEEDEESFIMVPAGDYVVEVFTYLDTMSGRVHRERWGKDGLLGAWFRHDHPGMGRVRVVLGSGRRSRSRVRVEGYCRLSARRNIENCIRPHVLGWSRDPSGARCKSGTVHAR